MLDNAALEGSAIKKMVTPAAKREGSRLHVLLRRKGMRSTTSAFSGSTGRSG